MAANIKNRSADAEPLGPWSAMALAEIEDFDPAWARACREMSTNPWTGNVLDRRFVALIGFAVSIACTSLDRTGSRQHMRAALAADATRDQILTVIKMATVMSIHSCSLAAPILLEEAGTDALAAVERPAVATPHCDAMKAIGQWNQAWDPFYRLDAQWTDQFMATGAAIYQAGVFTPKEIELLSIAFDASFTHMYAPGTRRHIKGALASGAGVAEIMEVLKICVACGVAACNLAIPMLAEELASLEASP